MKDYYERARVHTAVSLVHAHIWDWMLLVSGSTLTWAEQALAYEELQDLRMQARS